MRASRFQGFGPICPACRQQAGAEHALSIAAVHKDAGDEVIEGLIHCPSCQREYPVLDGIPVLVPDVRAWISQSVLHIQWRDDLSEASESLLGDCCGPGSAFDLTRQYLSTYGWGHYHDLDPELGEPGPPAVVAALRAAVELAGPLPPGPVLDLGCSVGRTAMELAAATGRPTLGIDLNFSMLRAARRAAAGEVCYPLRRGGLVYDRRRFPASIPGADAVEWWIGDATCLPLASRQFALVTSFNLLDCVPSPYDHLAELDRALAPGGKAAVACPYDWSANATDPTAWIGGHSQRSGWLGQSDAILRALLTPGAHPHALPRLRLRGEREGVPWDLRLHARSRMSYRLHLAIAEAEADGAQP